MINQQRVKRIKSVIYTIVVILVIAPLILLMALCISMIGFLRDTSGSLNRIETYIAGEAEPGGTPGTESSADSSLTPRDQAAKPTGQADTPIEALLEPEDAGSSPDTQSQADEPAVSSGTPNSYQPETHPELYFDTLATPAAATAGALYLTFDNTPSSRFPELMEVLDRHNVKATFFVWWGDTGGAPSIGSDYGALLNAGHSIGIHSGEPSLSLSSLYSSVDSFLDDFSLTFNAIETSTGIRTRLYRLPGGSVNPYNQNRQEMLRQIKQELDSRGFIQHDWNASAQDAVNPPLSMQQILDNLYTTIEKGEPVIALFHDGTGSDSTVRALDEFIPACLAQGYTFATLDETTAPVSFIDR